ncbi:MAG: phosphoenolpyruvate carboxykinase (ATP) [Actinomycetota bacterium]
MALEEVGISTTHPVRANLSASALVEQAIKRGEAILADNGALVARTFDRTGRSPKDKFTVRDQTTETEVWWGPNQPTSPETFDALWRRAREHLSERELFVVDAWVCADPENRVSVRVVAEFAWHALFAYQLFRRPPADALGGFAPDWILLSAPTLEADPARDGTNTKAFVAIDFAGRRVLALGTHYAGEIKKSMFTVLNHLLPKRGVFPMHCSANVGADGDVALFFGLSGTGKTTLSADPERRLIGDDEHGWSDAGVFNFEGGCYAKCINLSEEKEPQIWEAIRFGSVVENVVVDDRTRKVDYDDDSITENTRAAYPLEFIPRAVTEGVGGHPGTVVFLTADASGVLPPVSILDPAQAAYHFLSGFTSKLAGTEAGMGDEPEATFSTCFASPFLPLHPTVYSKMLEEKIARHRARVFLINTGWTGGPYGIGRRMDLPLTRRIVSAAIGGELDWVETETDPLFGFAVPKLVRGVPDDVLRPRDTWSDQVAYDAAAKDLASRFAENFTKYAKLASEEVRRAGPRV